MRASLVAAVLILAVLSACAARTGPDTAATPAEGAKVNPALENTYWKLIQLGGNTQLVGKDKQEPHITLRPDQKRVAGTGGCNQLMGAYTLEGERLTFGKLAGTMMACAEGMEQEQAFANALQRTTRWRIVAGKLELLDDSGAVLTRFEAHD